LSHIPGGNIATAYFRPQLLPNWKSTQRRDRPIGIRGWSSMS
jgi:hypothetical protein